jgi:regulator of protease activity HflC (stomatin/prohibitin superfamily)
MAEIGTVAICLLGSLLVGGIAVIASAVRIVQEWERGVVFRLGRLAGTKGPGVRLIVPVIDRLQKVSLQRDVIDVPPQDMITSDNVTVSVNAVAFYRVFEPDKAIVDVRDFRQQTFQLVQTTLRSVIGQSELDGLLKDRESINRQVQQLVDVATEPFGVKVGTIEVKDVGLPQSMQRAMAKEAEAERERRAKVIHATGEFQAAKELRQAADMMSGEPAALQLRFLQTLTEIAVEKNSTIIFPVPIDIFTALVNVAESIDGRSAAGSGD